MKLPREKAYVLAWPTGEPMPVIARWESAAVLSPEVDSWPGCVWHDGEDGNPDGDGELHAPQGWFVAVHHCIGDEFDSYWLGKTDIVDAWVPLPERPDREPTLSEAVAELRKLWPKTEWAKLDDPYAELHRIRYAELHRIRYGDDPE